MTQRIIRIDFLNEKVDKSFTLGKVSGIIAALNREDKIFSLHGNTKFPSSYVLAFQTNDEDYEKIKQIFIKEFGHMSNVTITIYEKKRKES